jgi:hypothetical protein
MTEVGDKGVVMDTFGDKVFVPLADTLNVGDSVAVYNLVDDTRIAVPILAFDMGYHAFVTPSFDFAGFNWDIDFDFNLIPLNINLIDHAHRVSDYIVDRSAWVYGDTFYAGDNTPCCNQDVRFIYGTHSFAILDNPTKYGPYNPEESGNVFIETKQTWSSMHIWVWSRCHGYTHKVYWDDTLLWSGTNTRGYCEPPILVYDGVQPI